ncbi:NYN domain-containing protein (plasmid) [Cobetia amphilecti]|uniref:NYN domain-containing protein n=1 Tax=Cobetia amphilecti TaxID=1055104 RepID=UPI0029439A3B|nr:NYN domain-containing protein [Cobetia amphilecti]WOI27634.1 NYN domain-containing protein [Cobetia amphilecti]WOI27639.1 NYN domain-containing protein [Cobetia amphilecti]
MRAMVFVDYWNLQVTLQQQDGLANGLSAGELGNHRFEIDWFQLGPKLTELAAIHASPTDEKLDMTYEETRIYTSTDPNNPRESSYRNFVKKTLDNKPGIRVFCLDRRPKRPAVCPACHNEMDTCAHCGDQRKFSQEKGVDTLLAVDMLRLGLDKSYDIALLVSQDSDMAPAADHLASKGIKVIQVGLKHFGSGVAASCWANFDLFQHREYVRRSR